MHRRNIVMLSKIITGIILSLAFISPASAQARCGIASYYGIGDGFHGRTAANGSRFNTYAHTTAHKHLPFGTRIKVINSSTKRSTIVVVTDRGPFIRGRILDLSYAAFRDIAPASQGLVDVCYDVL